ncbi:probable terpene synthase 6, partial [Tanacetum coccineum]
SREEMMNWVKHTAYSLGYVIVTKRSKQCKNVLTNKLVLMCDRGGEPSGSGSMVCDQHNHRPTENLEGHAYARRLSEDEFRLVEDLTSKTVPPREILSTLKDQDETNLSTLPTIYEAQKKIRKNEKGAKTPMQFLMLSMYINSGECIPLEAIDIFWRTLNLSPAKSLQSDHIRCDTELNHFKEHFKKQSEVGKRSFPRKLVDIFNPSKTTMKPPTVKRNTRRRPSLKQQQQQQQKRNAPPKSSQSARFFEVDLNVEPERHSSYTNYQTNYDRDPIPDLNEEPTRHSLFVDLNEEPANFFYYIPETNHFVPPTVDSHRLFVVLNEEPVTNPLLDDIPGIFHRYIKDLNNVKGDGNCGFRSVAVGLGCDENMWPLIRQELLQELRRPVVFISMVKMLYLVLHAFRFGPVHMKGYPIPSTHPQWRTYRIDKASAWEDMYSNRQLAFEEYIRSRR